MRHRLLLDRRARRCRDLTKNPALLASGEFEIVESTPWLVRLLGGRARRKRMDVADALADPSVDLGEGEPPGPRCTRVDPAALRILTEPCRVKP